MDMNQYQRQARAYALYPIEYRVIYPALGLAGEAGEVAEKVKKNIRDGSGTKIETAKEIGDVLWYCANLAHDLGFTLNEIADMNLYKLSDRRDRNVLKGDGDDR